ncbi:sigma-70 family RNA polymerase sigma factor [Oscillatoria salina]|uniref:sigma-70 family RNA polymerase sigma factor n=1 Tax=Oscillatoria salina TaxID=331517 RepID=UPI001CCCE772|nr:sigma-70 family RNA polymerase sigma factor [Oscillatoria salina]MBZ8180852.1 sigma-70 family RNA polymerase sigma factor [Oscillatoria salina IIICB1]
MYIPNDMSELDQYLKELALEVQRYSPGSRKRRKALDKLIRVMQRPRVLPCLYPGRFKGFYEEILSEAKQQLFLYICQNINNYNPEKGEVLQWIKPYFKRFFIQASREFMPIAHQRIEPAQIKRLSIDELEINDSLEVNEQQNYFFSEEVKHFVEEDSEGIFRETHIRSHPGANFQSIFLRRTDGYSWEEISSSLSISVSTLSRFYQRCLKKFAPLFQEHFQ